MFVVKAIENLSGALNMLKPIDRHFYITLKVAMSFIPSIKTLGTHR
jgi:hypothetical protein